MRFSAARVMLMIAGRGWRAAPRRASQPNSSRREAMEEAGIRADAPRWTQWRVFLRRISVTAIFGDPICTWSPRRAFGLRLDHRVAITLSREHTARLLRRDSNRTALSELDERLTRGDGRR